MNILDNYTDEQLSDLVTSLSHEVATRKQARLKEAAEKEARPKVSITVAMLESCWKYGCRGDKVAMVHKYLFGGAEYYLGILTGKWGAQQVMLRFSMGTASVVNYIPDGAREILPRRQQTA